MKLMFCRWKFSILLVLFVTIGCSDPGPLRHSAKGTLLLDGEPLPYKSLYFWPIDGTVGQGAGGCTDGEGKFNLHTVVPGALRDYRGCQPGRYCVIVGEPLLPIGDTSSEANIQGEVVDGEGPAAAVAIAEPTRRSKGKPSIPAIYQSQNTTPLIVEVSEEVEFYELTMDSKPRASLTAVQYHKRN
ncbi:hypothetical protein DSM3645_29272 [Blastopirellula marina DSM 3645]|uniref:Lipoprotein n=2 Tax=Blastopirellula marina TaxID=124 RepID=A3ZPS4_9BACT|nr:hypothetical protein DSM3645_29272 [Blastopirellula marina DSM 3645]